MLLPWYQSLPCSYRLYCIYSSTTDLCPFMWHFWFCFCCSSRGNKSCGKKTCWRLSLYDTWRNKRFLWHCLVTKFTSPYLQKCGQSLITTFFFIFITFTNTTTTINPVHMQNVIWMLIFNFQFSVYDPNYMSRCLLLCVRVFAHLLTVYVAVFFFK